MTSPPFVAHHGMYYHHAGPRVRYFALKEGSGRRGKSIGQLIDGRLGCCGMKIRETCDLVLQAHARSGIEEDVALKLASLEVRTRRA